MTSRVPASPWTWDDTRKSYFWWSANENCYIYEDGSKVQAAGVQNATQSTAQDPRYVPPADIRRTSANSGTSGGYNYGAGLSDTMSNLTINQGTPSQAHQAYTSHQFPLQHTASPLHYNTQQQPYATQRQYQLNQQYQQQQQPNVSPFAATQDLQNTSGQQTPQLGTNLPSESVPGDVVYERFPDPSENTDPTLWRHGAKSYRRLRGTESTNSSLNADYKIQRPGKDFFRLGKVFKIYWPEPISQTLTGKTSVTAGGGGNSLNREIYAKIRWFVVVKSGEGRYCSCLPIQTYGNQGVAKKDVVKRSHAIIYTGKEPAPNENELPGPGEPAMLQSIRVVSNKRIDIMDPMSRVDFSKIYTVEHNVKVYDFGWVHKDSRNMLRHQFQYVWSINQDTEEESDEEPEQSEKKKKKRERYPKGKTSSKGEKSSRGEKSTNTKRATEADVQRPTIEQTSVQTQEHHYYTATQAYNGPDARYLSMKAVDNILFAATVSDDWWRGRNERTGEVGMFPRAYVKQYVADEEEEDDDDEDN
ncbi:hypothetical protein FKW77_009452 [Venturia effusa]|uniref:SH3 domain-containing protein n=1 Tax=Venturia effusa TaxID=50376 RepID=A0A517L204_9PEZI|nr:hypothetical protein FKW77_009452 [Venturia effusa]